MHRKSGIRVLGKDWNCQDEFIENKRLEMRLQGLTSKMGGFKEREGKHILGKGKGLKKNPDLGVKCGPRKGQPEHKPERST